MDTKEKNRRRTVSGRRTQTGGTKAVPAKANERRRAAAAPRKKAAAPARAKAPAPTRRRKTATANTPNRAERQRRIQQRRLTKAQNPPKQQRVIRPPREEIPRVTYTPPRPMRRASFLWKLVSMAAVVAAVFMGLSVFFRVDTITVAGADKYTPWRIRQAAGVETGDALLSISEARVASRIVSQLPYIDEVKVGIRLPGTVEIQVKELQVTYSIADESGSWWLISSDGRAVESVTKETAQNYTRVEGLAIRTPQPGESVQAQPGHYIDPGDGETIPYEQSEADRQLENLICLLSALERSRVIGEITRIDVTDPSDIRLEYPHLLTVRLGKPENIEYKIALMAGAVEQLAPNQSGELDLSFEYAEEAYFHFGS